MRKPTSPKIVVGPNDSMPDILTRLRSATGGPAALAIPATSSLLLTASEFRALKAAAEQARVSLTVETDDRLRRQLATMFKIPVIDLLPGAVSNLEDSAPVAPDPTPSTSSAPPPVERSHQVMPDVPKLDLPPAVEVTPKWEPPSEEEKNSDQDQSLSISPPSERRSFRFPLKAVLISILALASAITVAIGLAYFFQKATVTITVKRQAVTADLTYAVVSPGASTPGGAAFAVTASPVTLKVPYLKTIPVTGALREPDQIASGKVALRNPTDKVIELAAGTKIADRDNIEYETTTVISVPAADSATGPGRAEVEIRAVVGGEAANRDVGMLSGKLDNGLYYSNRDVPISGGTDRKTLIVDQADIDKLISDATSEIPGLAVSSPLADGRVVLPGTLQAGELTYTIDHSAGDKAETVSIEAEMVVTGMAFLPSDAATQASIQLQDDLTASTPSGFAIEPASITIGSPVLINDSGDAGLYRITATASAATVVDDATRRQLAETLAGMSVDDAETAVSGLSYVDSFTIESSPEFLPLRIPSSADKIEIETK